MKTKEMTRCSLSESLGIMITVLCAAALMMGCKDDVMLVHSNVVPVNPPHAAFVNFRKDTTVAELARIVLRWTTDSLVTPRQHIALYAKDAGSPTWRKYRILDQSTRKLEIPLNKFSEKKLRFGIGLEGGSVADSTGIIWKSR